MKRSAGEDRCIVPLSDGKTEAIARIIKERATPGYRRLLVVGCGSGVEAAILSQQLAIEVVGIDLSDEFDPLAAQYANLRTGDATCLDFGDQSFDIVYSYHALEHIPAFRQALSEMQRVLKKTGTYCIGTPNRYRLIGYLGSKDATIRQKVQWNMADWRARIRGEFRNEKGAHAGFSPSELRSALGRVFSEVEDITLSYYLQVYPRHETMIRLLNGIGMGPLLLPSIYFVGKE